MWAAIVIIIVAIILAIALQPGAARNPNAGPTKGTVPDVKDGKRVVRVYGTIWINDPIQLAMLNTSQTPIRK